MNATMQSPHLAYDFGMVGLGTMGANLLLNVADHGFRSIGFDLDAKRIAALEESATPHTVVKGVTTLQEMVGSLSKPRRIMMLVPAGKPVDAVLNNLKPLLEPGDVVIDGGNSYYADTLRRVQELAPTGIHFMGMGVSGGEDGARYGPAMMPGGNQTAFASVAPILEAIAAKAPDGAPCVAYMGKGAAGHYVKMVHNGIEYGVMQLISEVYAIMQQGAGYNAADLATLFGQWNEGKLKSYLVEITAQIFTRKDDLGPGMLIDKILDKAGSKGTGKWTSLEALNLGVSIPTIDAAVSMRMLSGYKDSRVEAAKQYQREKTQPVEDDRLLYNSRLEDALYAAILLCYAQGLNLISEASKAYEMDVPLKDAVKVWRAGCIIRSTMLGTFYNAFAAQPALTNILLDEGIADLLKTNIKQLRHVVAQAVQGGIAVGALSSALAYFDNYTTERMPTNLIQAQRDFFGAHTYQRTDKEGVFHTLWEQETGYVELTK